MKKPNQKQAELKSIRPQQPAGTVQEYLNLCAAIGERNYKIHCLEAEVQEGYKKAAELEKQIMAEQKAVQTLREEAQKEAGKILG